MKIKIKQVISLLSISIIFCIGCEGLVNDNDFKYPPDNQEKVTIKQGIWGNVWFWEGNFMPVVDPDRAKITAVVREVYIYKAAADTMTESVNNGPWFRNIKTEFVVKVISDKTGFFQVNLPPGIYSLFVKEDSLFFAAIRDQNGFISSAEVFSGEITKRQIDINYKAAY